MPNQLQLQGLNLDVAAGGRGLVTAGASCQNIEEAFQMLVTFKDLSGWWFGDVLLEISSRLADKETPKAERDRYRGMESQIKRLVTQGKRLAETRIACQRISADKRRKALSFEMHLEVLKTLQDYGKSSDEEIDTWLNQCEEVGYSMAQLRLAMRAAFRTPGTEETEAFVSTASVLRPFKLLRKEIDLAELTPAQADQIRADFSEVEQFLKELTLVAA